MSRHENSKELIVATTEQNPAESDAGSTLMDSQAFLQKIARAESWQGSDDAPEDSDLTDGYAAEVDEFFEDFDPVEAIKSESENKDAGVDDPASNPVDLPDNTVIELQPKQTLENIEQLHQQLKQMLANQQTVEVDASAVNHIDAATLQLMAAFQQALVKQQKEFIINFPSEHFIEAAQLTGLDEFLKVDQAASGFF